MSADIEQTIAHELARWDALIEVDDGTILIWVDLVRKTAPLATKLGFFMPRLSAVSAFNPVSYGWHSWMDEALRDEQKDRAAELHGLPRGIIDEWDAYAVRWQSFLELNPRAKIAEILSDISESNDSSSFPYSWEHVVLEWVKGSCEAEPPFYRAKHLDGRWQQDLLETWKKTDGGWVYWEDHKDHGGVLVWR